LFCPSDTPFADITLSVVTAQTISETVKTDRTAASGRIDKSSQFYAAKDLA